MDTPSLPTPRTLLTSLITTLITGPIATGIQTQVVNPTYDQPSNPLKALPPSQRAVLSTLHVLLPTGVLLQSLDLLERGLVVRVVENSNEQRSSKSGGRVTTGGGEPVVVPPQAHVHLPESDVQHQGQWQGQTQTQALAVHEQKEPQENQRLKTGRNVIYQVRSSQPPKSRFKDPISMSTNLTYTVRLESWNCSCAAFVFESFPGGSTSSEKKEWLELGDEDDPGGKGERGREDGMERAWKFGGLSFDGMGEEGHVPVCKHLLACLLAERWELLGSYVKERVVGREEMAGVGGEV